LAGKRKRKGVSGSGVFRRGLDGGGSESVVGDVEVDVDHVVKARLRVDVVEMPCELCGKPAMGDQVCQECGIVVCDDCVGMVGDKRYCPACFVEVKKLSKLL
jgi:hypothetical protein